MPSRRLQSLLFALSFITFAWFHQGGGWNQNARFAQVRAIVEEGTLAVDDYLVYESSVNGRMIRERVVKGEHPSERGDQKADFVLCWGPDSPSAWHFPVNGKRI